MGATEKLKALESPPTCSRCRTKTRPRETVYVGRGARGAVLCARCGGRSEDESLKRVEVPSYRWR